MRRRRSATGGSAKRPSLGRQHWKTLRARARERDGHRCQRCGSTDRLSVHHITPARLGGADVIENLITLCSRCHAAADAQLRRRNDVWADAGAAHGRRGWSQRRAEATAHWWNISSPSWLRSPWLSGWRWLLPGCFGQFLPTYGRSSRLSAVAADARRPRKSLKALVAGGTFRARRHADLLAGPLLDDQTLAALQRLYRQARDDRQRRRIAVQFEKLCQQASVVEADVEAAVELEEPEAAESYAEMMARIWRQPAPWRDTSSENGHAFTN